MLAAWSNVSSIQQHEKYSNIFGFVYAMVMYIIITVNACTLLKCMVVGVPQHFCKFSPVKAISKSKLCSHSFQHNSFSLGLNVNLDNGVIKSYFYSDNLSLMILFYVNNDNNLDATHFDFGCTLWLPDVVPRLVKCRILPCLKQI